MITQKEQDETFCMALIIIVRRAMATMNNPDATEAWIETAGDCARNEVANMLIEHLSNQQIADIASGVLAKAVAETLMQFLVISKATTGKIDTDHIIKITEKFCSDKLGREVKV